MNRKIKINPKIPTEQAMGADTHKPDALGEKPEDQDFKASLSYLLNSRPA